MTDSEILQKIEKSKQIIAYFSYPTCNVCKTLRPKVEELVGSYSMVEFLYIDTQIHPTVSGQNMVFAVPTIILFVGGKEAKRWSRHLSVREIKEELERWLISHD